MAEKKLPRRPGGPKTLPPPPRSPAKAPKRPGESGANALPRKPAKPATRSRPSGPPPARRVRKSSGSGRSWLKLLFLAVLLLVVVASGAGGFVFYQLRGSLPQVEGTSKLQGLTTQVEVLRDKNGVPHLFGADIRDLARAMGYTHAQDRFFQMELSRRLGSGRLAEIFGASALANDRVARRMGLASAARMELERMAPEAREVLEAYASGVNAYLTAHVDRLPPELRLLELTPSPWEAVDSLAIGKWMAYLLSYNGRVEMLRGNLTGVVGLEDAYRITGLAPPPEALPSSESAGARARISALEATSPELLGVFPGASNAWVVGGQKSATGRPLLASDPHLGLTMPSTWYEIHLSGGGYEVSGASLPGVPLVLIGQNRRIAWGITALLADVQDLYLETPNPENPRQYAAPEGFRDLEVVTETIPVKDGSAATEEVRVSRHGVIVGETEDGRLLAQRWDALWSGDHFQALLLLNRAGSWEEFTSSLRTWASPPLAFLYADVEGNIGFFPAGEIPVRTAHDGTVPVDGATDSYEWQGSIPHELKPMIFNPEDGILVSANHSMLPPETPYPFGSDTLASYRADRIRDLLRTIPKSTLDDFARIQADRYDASTAAVLRIALGLRPAEGKGVEAIEKLRGWNGQMTDGPAPAIYQALYRRLIENTFKDEIGDELFPSYLDFLELGHLGGLHAVVDDEASPYWDDRGTPGVETRERIFLESMGEAVELLSSRQGDDVNAWDWRRLHEIRFEHPMGAEGPLLWLFSRGPVPFGGSTYTVANAVVSLREPFETPLGTSLRFLADLSNPDLSRSIIPTGASGHPLSPHYFDQNQGWLEGKSHTLLFERATIEDALESKLVLQP